jgi:hypothetical protein
MEMVDKQAVPSGWLAAELVSGSALAGIWGRSGALSAMSPAKLCVFMLGSCISQGTVLSRGPSLWTPVAHVAIKAVSGS